ncbi:unnamed protein product [Blepharisma stoltei]|uniref:PAP-associated domain-containing protein n=1 Tax=Blepharisma stoltei TaxID=1481888 RepID=A0AAU9JXE0_9CILI|nr:unnamed protein product [Blepharisma stoltei]
MISSLIDSMSTNNININIDFQSLSEEIAVIFTTSRLSNETISIYEGIRTRLDRMMKLGIRSDCSVEIYGSARSGFGIVGSDLDLNLTFPQAVEELEVLKRIKKTIRNSCISSNIIEARTRILKFRLTSHPDVDSSISLNNYFALRNTELLNTYSKIDERVPQLVVTVKHWAKMMGIADTIQHTLSQYAHSLLVIYFLQRRQPPILPNLQNDNKISDFYQEFDCGFDRDYEKYRELAQRNTETIGELLYNYFRFYESFGWYDTIVDISRLERARKESKPIKSQWTKLICIRDPFLTVRNLGDVCNKEGSRKVISEFGYAAAMISEGRSLAYVLNNNMS